MKTFRIAIVALMAVALASCVSTGSINTALQTALPKTCANIERVHIAFSTVAATGKIKESTVNKEAKAYAVAQGICANPESVTVENAPILVAQAYATIIALSVAVKEAERE